MPIKNYVKIIANVEPDLATQLQQTCDNIGIDRAKLLRMTIKYLVVTPSLLNQIILNGDKPQWSSKNADKAKGKKPSA